MKYVIIVTAIVFAITACNNGNSHVKRGAPTTPTDSLINNSGQFANDEYAEGARLIAANDCITCHKIDQKSIGPAFRDIANKYHFYEGNVDNLAGKVISGGKGLWGDIAMTPHPSLNYQDAKKMVTYILSLKAK